VESRKLKSRKLKSRKLKSGKWKVESGKSLDNGVKSKNLVFKYGAINELLRLYFVLYRSIDLRR